MQLIRVSLEEQYPSNEPNQTKDTILRHFQGKQRRNGPIYGFHLPAGPTPIRGLIARYGIEFSSEAALDQSFQDRITSFLNSLNLGSIRVSRKVVAPKQQIPNLTQPLPLAALRLRQPRCRFLGCGGAEEREAGY